MATSASVKNIHHQDKNFNKQDQLALLEQIVVLLHNRETDKSKFAKLSTLSGIGNEI
jgi:Tat protein secretion system quality control protein TatD with DNase activity